MFGLSKSHITKRVESINLQKPHLQEAIKLNIAFKNEIYLHLDHMIKKHGKDINIGFMLTAHLPFFVGYIAGKLEDDIFFRKSDAIETLLILQYFTFPNLNEKQTNMMEKMCSELADSNFFDEGMNFAKHHSGADVVSYFMALRDSSLNEIKDIVRRNS
jgi:hypothetical protein